MTWTNEAIRDWFKNGKIKLATVSGVWSTKPNIIHRIDEEFPAIDLITTKSFQVAPNPGNREPIIAEKSAGTFANAVGLRNPGLTVVRKELKELRQKHNFRTILNVSISGSTPEEFVELAVAFESFADMFELNFSCPHAKPGYGSTIGSSAELVYEYVKAIKAVTNKLVFPKLTPNVENIGEIARAAVRAGADGLVAINTVGPELISEAHSGKAILYNPLGHKGGISGKDVFTIAIAKIKEIRQAIGNELPVIGMGGISNGSNVAEMIRAGADVVGVGTVLARIPGKYRKKYFEALKSDALSGTTEVEQYITPNRVAHYEHYTIQKIEEPTPTFRVVTLNGVRKEYKASQYAFLWIPGAGEKPFSLAWNDPMQFVIRKREHDPDMHKGEFTQALFQLKTGDSMYLRGMYGAEAPITNKKEAIILSGGTGVADVPKLAQRLSENGIAVTAFHGAADEREIFFADLIGRFACFVPVVDDGKPGRVLDELKQWHGNLKDVAFYTIGPDILMEKGLETVVKLGISTEVSFASLETNHMCGIGICGECEVGGILSCHHGTFYDYNYLKRHYFKKL